ncbi:hypothetical protein OHT77_15315 [Streptomyces sp. NBC_00252]|uniref:hypothetical protein n=1 Tax=Streptomyces sp. NBC_00252 TaxID=2975691 RepID=UPI002E2E209C|nr:hypothetical protein [Streptomyces sp. NBC_00252]
MTYELSDTPEAVRDANSPTRHAHRLRLNKVPEITVYFWIIKVLCTTVGETAADLLNEKAGLGLTGVSVLMSALLAVVLVVQFRTRAYRAGVYWLAVALISVVGSLISLTRPLGTSIGDYLSQPTGDGGLGLGTVVTSVLFLAVILGMVVYLTVTRKDVIDREPIAGQAA